jgi:hypothetical protein
MRMKIPQKRQIQSCVSKKEGATSPCEEDENVGGLSVDEQIGIDVNKSEFYLMCCHSRYFQRSRHRS